jgi:hypothetical protein
MVHSGYRIEVRFADGRITAASDVKRARLLVESQPLAADIWSVWPNDLGVGTRIDHIDPARPTDSVAAPTRRVSGHDARPV